MSNLFNGDPVVPQVDPQKNYFEELVGDGKKFKTPEELARGKAEADAFIEQLKREQEALRTELNTKLSLEQYVDKMAASGNEGRNPVVPNEPKGPQGEEIQGLKPEDVERIIDQRVAQKDLERVQETNLRTVREALSASLGPEFATKLKSIGESIGMSPEDMNDMAKSRPKALLALVGAAPRAPEAPGLFSPPSGQSNTQLEGRTIDRTQKYYRELKAKDAKSYWSPAVQNQLHKDALRLGEKFFD